jgi:hypothetical protein
MHPLTLSASHANVLVNAPENVRFFDPGQAVIDEAASKHELI